MTVSETRRPLYFDCDTGVDDALALAYLLASPEIELLGIGSVSGNTSAAQAAKNTLDLLALAGRPEVPVAVGEHDPLAGSYDGGAPGVHGDNGIGGIALPESGLRPVAEDAPDMLIRLAHEHPGELVVLAVGPLANLAVALRRDPSIAALVRDVVVMGGAVYAPGNITPTAEANIWHDPEAAAEVLAAEWRVTLVPLDITLEHLLPESDRQELLGSTNPLNSALGAMLEGYFAYYVGQLGRAGCALHDPLAAAIATGALEVVRSASVPIAIGLTADVERGRTVPGAAADAHPDARIAVVVLETDLPLAPHLMARLRG